MGRRVDVEAKLIGHYKAPRANVLLALFDEINDMSQKNGILIPSTWAQHRNERVGTVVAVGSKIYDLKVGDRVLLDKRLGLRIEHEDAETNRLAMLSEDQVLGILDGKALEPDYDFVRDGI